MKILALALLAFAAVAGALDLPKKFDAARDPARDVAAAAEAARAQGKRVLVDVGGEWCVWCHILDDFIAANPDVRAAVESSYVMVKVNWSPQNRNEAFLSTLPAVKGYPHLFVLDGNAKLVHSQDTDVLEEGRGYNKAKFLAFLQKWSTSEKRDRPFSVSRSS
jgi:thiol:disulfide interchange protein